MKSLLTFFITALALANADSANAAATYRIDWELSHPFRMFSPYDRSDAIKFFDSKWAFDMERSWKPRRDLYVWGPCKNSNRPVLCSENAVGSGRIKRMQKYIHPDLLKNDGNGAIWEAILKEGTRYRSGQAPFGNGPNDRSFVDLVQSAEATTPHRVLLSLRTSDGTIPPSARCAWTIDGNEKEGDCTDFIGHFKRTIPSSVESSTVAVKWLNQPAVKVPSLQGASTRITEHLIVAMGDSFASGEGNPDVPFWPGKISNGVTTDKWPDRSPVGSPNVSIEGAHWFDRRCHRSLLGSQMRAVIQLAALHPKREFTLLGVACSGAEVGEGLLKRYQGVEFSTEASDARNISQFNQVLLELCADAPDKASLETLKKPDPDSTFILPCKKLKRTIDAILISVGGNDIRFSDLLAHAFLSNIDGDDNSFVVQVTKFREDFSPDDARGLLPTLAKSYAALRTALHDRFGSTPTIATSYPDLMMRTDGKSTAACGRIATEKTELASGLERLPSDLNLYYNREVIEDLQDLISELNQTLRKENPDWRIASSHEEFFKSGKHSICSSGCESASPEMGGPNWMSSSCTALPGQSKNYFLEGHLDPRLGLADKAKGRPGLNSFFKYNAFARTVRYFRTANDAAMVVNQKIAPKKVRAKCREQIPPLFRDAASAPCESLLDELEALRGGAAHPNSYGAAVLADAYLIELRKVLKLN